MTLDWTLYLLRSDTGRHYTGITTDLERRLRQHNGELPGGAKATRPGRPWKVLRTWGPFDRSKASQLEYQLKQIPGKKREDWNP